MTIFLGLEHQNILLILMIITWSKFKDREENFLVFSRAAGSLVFMKSIKHGWTLY